MSVDLPSVKAFEPDAQRQPHQPSRPAKAQMAMRAITNAMIGPGFDSCRGKAPGGVAGWLAFFINDWVVYSRRPMGLLSRCPGSRLKASSSSVARASMSSSGRGRSECDAEPACQVWRIVFRSFLA